MAQGLLAPTPAAWAMLSDSRSDRPAHYMSNAVPLLKPLAHWRWLVKAKGCAGWATFCAKPGPAKLRA